MMNTIEYRVDCQLLHYLHHENHLGTRLGRAHATRAHVCVCVRLCGCVAVCECAGVRACVCMPVRAHVWTRIDVRQHFGCACMCAGMPLHPAAAFLTLVV